MVCYTNLFAVVFAPNMPLSTFRSEISQNILDTELKLKNISNFEIFIIGVTVEFYVLSIFTSNDKRIYAIYDLNMIILKLKILFSSFDCFIFT